MWKIHPQDKTVFSLYTKKEATLIEKSCFHVESFLIKSKNFHFAIFFFFRFSFRFCFSKSHYIRHRAAVQRVSGECNQMAKNLIHELRVLRCLLFGTRTAISFFIYERRRKKEKKRMKEKREKTANTHTYMQPTRFTTSGFKGYHKNYRLRPGNPSYYYREFTSLKQW